MIYVFYLFCYEYYFILSYLSLFFFFSSRRRHTRCSRDWSSDVCSSDLCSTTRRGTIRRPALPCIVRPRTHAPIECHPHAAMIQTYDLRVKETVRLLTPRDRKSVV